MTQRTYKNLILTPPHHSKCKKYRLIFATSPGMKIYFPLSVQYTYSHGHLKQFWEPVVLSSWTYHFLTKGGPLGGITGYPAAFRQEGEYALLKDLVQVAGKPALGWDALSFLQVIFDDNGFDSQVAGWAEV